MAWDAKKHKVIDSVRVEDDNHTIIIELYSYNSAAPRVALRQEVEKKGGEKIITPVGGMEPALALQVGRAMVKLCKKHLPEG